MTKSQALSNPEAIFKGWSPFSNNFSDYSINIPARITTPVVPSPISLSYEIESSTINLDMGWVISIFSIIVAPSLVIKGSPSGEMIILSIPFGPKEVLTIFAIAKPANKFYLIASIPLTLRFFSYSLTIR